MRKVLPPIAALLVGAAVAVPVTLVLGDEPPDIGSLGEWVGGIGAILAAVVALGLFEWQRRIDRERRELEDDLRHLRDLDDVRRLLYIALAEDMAPGSSGVSPHLAATVGHALAHHQGPLQDPDEGLELMMRMIDRPNQPISDDPRVERQQIVALIQALTAEIGDREPGYDSPEFVRGALHDSKRKLR